jgi:hypothetical protein
MLSYCVVLLLLALLVIILEVAPSNAKRTTAIRDNASAARKALYEAAVRDGLDRLNTGRSLMAREWALTAIASREDAISLVYKLHSYYHEEVTTSFRKEHQEALNDAYHARHHTRLDQLALIKVELSDLLAEELDKLQK